MRTRLPALMLLALAPAYAAAQPASPLPNAADQRRAEENAAVKDALQHAVHGPTNIALADIAHIRLPPNTLWFPADYARRLLRSWGNTPGPNTLGMFAGENAGHDWSATVSTTQEGFVKDNEREALDPAKILAQLRDQQAEANTYRIQRGFPGLELTGWLQNPSYDPATHRLVWALLLQEAGSADADTTVNYNTRNLGRAGYISLNLLTSPRNFAADKPVADALLSGFAYDPGKRYSDFNAGTDRVAEYGLAALIGVIALKKLGFLALGTAFALKFAKVGIVAVVAIGATIRRLFRRKPQPGPQV